MIEERKGPNTVSLVACGVLAVAALTAIYLLVASKPEKVPAPTSFTAFIADDKSFTCVSPEGWEVASGSAMGTMSRARFKRGPAKVEILSDLSGSLMGDIARSSASSMEGASALVPGMTLPPAKPPVESLHEMGRASVKREYKTYDESAPKPFQSKTGDSRYSEFNADGGLRVGKVHGYRVTMLGSERSISIVCACPEESWSTLQPAFQKVINSIAPGQG